MEHAATLIGHRRAILPLIACARLRQGSSKRATWILEDAPGGTTLTVGADASCDWQIRAAFVPPRAFTLRMIDGQVFVRAEHEPGVLLNGKPVGDGWSVVPSGSRLDVGLARLEVGVRDPLSRESRPPVTPVTITPDLSDAQAVRASEQVPSARSAPSFSAPHLSPNDLFDVLPFGGTGVTRSAPASRRGRYPRQVARPSIAPRSAAATLEELHQDSRGSLPVDPAGHREADEITEVTPALLDDGSPDKSPVLRYALVGAVTACAYGGWLALLDYL